MPMSLVRSYRRSFVLLLAAFLLASGVALATPRQAHAAGGACGGATWFDSPGTVYDNGDYHAAAGGQFYDNWQGKYTHLDVDIRSWRYTTTGSDGWPAGHCLRDVRWSGWVDDGSYGSDWLNYRMWVCGSSVILGGTGSNFEGGHELQSGWWDYSGCGGPQADDSYHGVNADWTPYYPGAVPSPYENL